MKLTKIESSINKVLARTGLYLKRKAPTLICIAGSAGVVATGILSAKATPKALMLLNERKELEGRDLTKFEKVIVTAPAYIPTAIAGATTIACIFGANALNMKKQASILSAYALLEGSYKKYRDKVIEMIGEDKDKEIKTSLTNDLYREAKEKNDICRKESSLGEVCTFFDEYSNRFFEMTMTEVVDAEYQLNREFALHGAASVNEFYSFLGWPETMVGEQLGWTIDNGDYIWIDFEHELMTNEDGSQYYIISSLFPPVEGYLDYEVCGI